MNGGWIKLHRKILDNDWLSKNRVYSNFEAFMFLLLKANHKDGSFHIGTQVVEVKRGQLVTSQKKLCKQFNWSNSKLRNYLKTAKNASMIHTETTSKTTCLTLLNYDTYQCSETEEALKKNQINTEKTLKKHTNNNNKELKNNKTLYDLFEKWWDLYDFKVGRDKCEKLWMKIPLKDLKLIMEHTKDYIRVTTKSEIVGGAFKPRRKNPSTYLNNKSWKDEIVKEELEDKFTVDDFHVDGGGFNKKGYCDRCGEVDFYTPYEVLSADSRCCSDKVVPVRRKISVQG